MLCVGRRPSSQTVRHDSDCGAAPGYSGIEADSCARWQGSQTGRNPGRPSNSLPVASDGEGTADSISGSSMGASVRWSDSQTDKASAATTHRDSLAGSGSCTRDQQDDFQTDRQLSWQRRFVRSWWFPQCVLLACQVSSPPNLGRTV